MTEAQLVEPAHLWMPDRAGSYGDEVADLADLYGRPLDPEQRLAVDAICSHRPDGRWAALEAAIIEGRQNGKTGGIILPVTLADLFLFDADRVVWTAHLFKTARDAFEDVKQIVDGCAELSRRVAKISESHGEEGVTLTSGARLEFLARSKGGGRGLGGKRLVLDEALFLAAGPMGALIPTLAARPNPQVLYGSSAGLATSDHLRALRDRGRAGGDPGLVWAEWCAPGGWNDPGCVRGTDCTHEPGVGGCALDDESRWAAATPALGRRITIEFVRGERRALPPEEFGRERLGWWDLPMVGQQPISPAQWAPLAVPRRRPRNVAPVFFPDVSPGMRSAAIGVAYTVRKRSHVELADHRTGAAWLVGRCAKLAKRYPGASWAVDGQGAIGALLPELAEAGIEPVPLGAADMGRACAYLQQLVAEGGLTHSGDDAITAALAGAVKRDVGDGLWAWGRRKSSVDICPVVVVTGALWQLALAPSYDVLDSVAEVR